MSYFNCLPLANLYSQARINGITQAEFAKKCKIDPSRMSKFLNGVALPSTKELAKICEALQCQPNNILEVKK